MLISIFINIRFLKDNHYSERYMDNADYTYWRDKDNKKQKYFKNYNQIL